jgi:hypothetical protein
MTNLHSKHAIHAIEGRGINYKFKVIFFNKLLLRILTNNFNVPVCINTFVSVLSEQSMQMKCMLSNLYFVCYNDIFGLI